MIKKKSPYFSLIILLLIFFSTNTFSQDSEELFFRFNQLGYLPDDIKIGVVLSKNITENSRLFLISTDNSTRSELILQKHNKKYNDFFSYSYDFSFADSGEYYFSMNGIQSDKFKISRDVYNSVADSLLLFFSAQRCGPTNPFLHEVCHLHDAAFLIGDVKNKSADLTGGWHDAGDYLKFLSTTALTTYMLIFAYQFNPEEYGFDNNRNNVPDILEEAKIGLDWLLRCNYEDSKLVTQVQDLDDHAVGWRLPEDDTLKFNRPGFVSIGKNIIGIYAAALASASRVWRKKFKMNSFAEKCLKTAEKFYAAKDAAPDIDSSFSGAYIDDNFYGKLSLAAIELYITTNEKKYLEDAARFAEQAVPDYWWSWGNYNGLLYYQLAKYYPEFSGYLKKNLSAFNENKNLNPFFEPLPYSWGTTTAFLGVSLQAILYKDHTGTTEFDSLIYLPRDYILGNNPWGKSFIYNIGNSFPQKIHSQIAYFNSDYLPGALVGGPAPKDLLEEKELRGNNTPFLQFNSSQAEYYDDINNYITNEPTIVGNATALFVFGFFINE